MGTGVGETRESGKSNARGEETTRKAEDTRTERASAHGRREGKEAGKTGVRERERGERTGRTRKGSGTNDCKTFRSRVMLKN